MSDGRTGTVGVIRRFLALESDVLVLSVAMLLFSLSFQMTSRFLPDYLYALGAGPLIVGAYGSLSNVLSAVYPYPGGAISDRIGSRYALTLFATLSTAGFAIWALAPALAIRIGGVTVPGWTWVFVGLVLAQGWKSLGLGATFAIVKQATSPSELATGFASTETFRRFGFLFGPVIAAAVLAASTGFLVGFQTILLIAVAFGAIGTVVQHVLYEAEADTVGKALTGFEDLVADLRALPDPLRPLLVADTLVRFANGMVYVFFITIVTQVYEVSYTVPAIEVLGVGIDPIYLPPAALFGVLLGIEMVVAILSMVPMARFSRRIGLKPVVALGFLVYAIFPAVLILSPGSPRAMIIAFAFSGLRFAGLPAHKALIVGPAERDTGGRVTGSYYLVRNLIVIPSALIGGALFDIDPALSFGTASLIGLLGVGGFLLRGQEFAPAIAN